ncbi:adenine-specific DNA-methyltransferase [Natronincola peptidivorans]|uniref:Methyltransferase n=1 Tax=Natronincola peptidivorans TaxID=426128 RepID=A0A1I0EKQ7_9FIRM|nr:site-specific DNA-methyltransferase [Natronincola peptidivorans]SET46041.1 adenine-specific DNA-methyltransferase [Natronincola peptidivorans]
MIIIKKFKFLEEFSYGVKDTDNMIIHGDNKKVLDQLSKSHLGLVKCIYIDPPYNNSEKYTHYKDDMGHDRWVDYITNTLKRLEPLLSQDGSIWISIDDNEVHYLKVLADKVFKRKNFLTTIIWEHRTSRENRKVFSNNHEYILVYAKNPDKFKASRNLLPATPEILKRYKNPDNDPRGPWQSVSAHVQAGHAVKSQFYDIIAPNGKVHSLPNGRCWAYNKERMDKEISENNIWFGKDGNGVPRIKKFLVDKEVGVTPETLWLGSEVGTTNTAKKHLLSLFPDKKVFDTPKPEELIKRILDISTNEGDIVLDAYLGSGTTSAVAHKMNRKYIGIEKGEHIYDIVVPRMQRIIDGEEYGGITKDTYWNCGGGYNLYQFKGVQEIKLKEGNTIYQVS